ncbi:MAG: hypothetical protein JWP01_3909 [Myxococcales bacterium]|nr:hypothetical protein [Myxococcales bacterium]
MVPSVPTRTHRRENCGCFPADMISAGGLLFSYAGCAWVVRRDERMSCCTFALALVAHAGSRRTLTNG